MPNAASSNSKRDRPYDLEERTALFGETVVGFAKRIPKGDVASPLISQLVRAATSIGANWCLAWCLTLLIRPTDSEILLLNSFDFLISLDI